MSSLWIPFRNNYTTRAASNQRAEYAKEERKKHLPYVESLDKVVLMMKVVNRCASGELAVYMNYTKIDAETNRFLDA